MTSHRRLCVSSSLTVTACIFSILDEIVLARVHELMTKKNAQVYTKISFVAIPYSIQ